MVSILNQPYKHFLWLKIPSEIEVARQYEGFYQLFEIIGGWMEWMDILFDCLGYESTYNAKTD